MKKTLLALAVTASIAGLSGCGSSDSNGGDDAVTTGSYSGTVNKGIVSNGKVEVCDVFDSAGCNVNESSFYYETVTTEDGSYDVSGAPMDTPLLVLVSEADNGETTMKCDVDSCGTDVQFGDTFNVESGWSLQAILPSANSGTSTVNVTSLTDIAADEAIEVAGSGGVVTEAIATNANYAVQNAFGLTKGITEVGSLDLTDADEVAAAVNNDSEELLAATYSASLFNSSDEDKKDLVTFDSSTGGYTIDNTDNGEVNSVLAQATSLLSTVENNANETLGDGIVNVTSIQAEIDALDIKSESSAIDAGDEVIATKAFIKNVRTAYNAVQDGGDLSNGLDDFASQFDDFDDLISDDLDSISDELTTAVSDIAAALENADEGDTEYDGSHYVVSINDDTYSIDDNGIEIITTITGTDSIEDNETSTECTDGTCSETWDSSADNVRLTITTLTITVNDTVLTATGNASLDGFNSAGEWSDSDSDNGWSGEQSENTSVDSLSINLDASLSYSTNASFTGEIKFSFNDLVATSEDSYNGSYSYDDTSEDSVYSDASEGHSNYTVEDMSLLFNGELEANNESAEIYLNLVADNSLGFALDSTWSETWECNWSNVSGENCNSSSDEQVAGETATNFVKASLIARVETNLMDANSDEMAASIELNANRKAYNVVDTSITIDYNDVDVILEADIGLYDTDSSDLIIRNTEGVVATINVLDDSAEELEGAITVNGVKAASIEDTDEGAALVRYTDGTFESLF